MMCWIFRLLAYVLVTAAALILGYDLWRLTDAGSFQMISLGRLWFQLSPESLQLAEPAIARHLHPFLWHPVIATVLLWPAVLFSAVPGVILLLLSRRRRTQIFFR